MSQQAKAQKLAHSLIRTIPGAHEENLRNLEAPYWGTKIPYGWSPFARGSYASQAVPTPAYLLPLPGQRSLVLGSPEGVGLDGEIRDNAAQRWTNVKDLRIRVNPPDGVTCATVESGDFVLFTKSSGPDQETVDSATAILDARLEDSQKPAPEAQGEGQEDE